MEFAVTIVLTIGVTWVVAHVYYRRTIRDQVTQIAALQGTLDKLPTQVAQHLIAEQRRKLTLEELEELITEADGYPTPYGLWPNKCPKCGGKLEIRGYSEDGDSDAWPACLACGWNGG
jgi:hypothetical protein